MWKGDRNGWEGLIGSALEATKLLDVKYSARYLVLAKSFSRLRNVDGINLFQVNNLRFVCWQALYFQLNTTEIEFNIHM